MSVFLGVGHASHPKGRSPSAPQLLGSLYVYTPQRKTTKFGYVSLQLHISRAVLTYTISEKLETTILHVYFLVLVSVRSRCLDPTPGTIFLGSLEALLHSLHV